MSIDLPRNRLTSNRLTDDSSGVIAELDAQSPVLVVVFGGLASSFGGTPPFEFLGALRAAGPSRRLFFRDDREAWYHRGVRGVADDVPGVAAYIQRIVQTTSPAKVVTLGCSAGGYAALLFGHLIEADEVHAFAPQTFISPGLRLRHWDTRFRHQWFGLLRSGRYRPRYGDLCRVFSRIPRRSGDVRIHYARTEALDMYHAHRLGDKYSYITLNEYDRGGHNIAKHLRDSGDLKQVLSGALVA